MELKIALAGNPNCGKTTLFNALTGSNQYVGNWPGVTVEKKEGQMKKQPDVIFTDLPGIYSLSPYTLEEVVSRNYLINERPDAILNIVDGTNLERNLYLTTQLMEIGIPVVIAINMMDIVRKRGDKIDIEGLGKSLGCKIVEISALKSDGIFEAAELAIEEARGGKTIPMHIFSGNVEHTLAHIEEAAVHGMASERQRWYSIKIFERDERVLKKLELEGEKLSHIEQDITECERIMDDDAEAIITNERYNYIEQLVRKYYKKKKANRQTASDKIDKIVTNRILALPIFAVIMFLVYFISIGSVGDWTVNFVNDGIFGDGWHLFGNGAAQYSISSELWEEGQVKIDEYLNAADSHDISTLAVRSELSKEQANWSIIESFIKKAKNSELSAKAMINGESVIITADEFEAAITMTKPSPENYGIWIPGVPVIVENALDRVGAADWLSSLIVEGIIGGVGAVLGFVPQMIILFMLLSILEDCGYMSRVAFILDRIFRKFGLSGKSFIPMLVATGCGVPGIMASRTIEQDRDRKMTVMTTGFIPCGAKMPIVSFIAAEIFGGNPFIATAAYFIGVSAVIISGLILKKTKPFAGNPAPFVMELPQYHAPVASNILRTTWDRGWSFVKRAGTVIFAASIIIWSLNSLSFEGGFHYITDERGGASVLEVIGGFMAWIFKPLGFGSWYAAVATILGLVAKEEIAGVLGTISEMEGISGIHYFTSALAGFSFLMFNLLCAPCFAAMGAIKREMNSPRWTAFAIGYMCVFAYSVSLITYQFGAWFIGAGNLIGTVAASAVLVFIMYMLFRKNKYENSDIK
ncbi:MAG: ferrous iron transporter B [Clostridia bacterium]|nr:ferrous iron transporter B [Clostridia bacterium]